MRSKGEIGPRKTGRFHKFGWVSELWYH